MIRIICALTLLIAMTACGSGSSSTFEEAGQARLPQVVLRSGSVELLAELARSEEERANGLMFRRSLEDGEGMLFVFESDQRLSFWMKNTYLPLSIAFMAADGTIREIRHMEPLSLAPVQSSRSVRYALEVPRGWFERVGLAPGDRFELPADLSSGF